MMYSRYISKGGLLRRLHLRPGGPGSSLLWPMQDLSVAIKPDQSPICSNNKHLIQFSTSQATGSSLEDPKLPKDAQLQLDFFGEPVTFLGLMPNDKTSNAMAALDSFVLAAVSKGKSCTGGGEEAGIEVQPVHASAIAWAEALRFAAVWNQPDTKRAAPMLVVAAVAPLLAQAGIAYVRHLDTLLKQAKPGVPGLPSIQMYDLAECASARKDDPNLNPRERIHLKALSNMIKDEHPTALAHLMKLLRSCPGDALALSLAMDLAHTLGDKQAALRISGSIASYWNERRGGLIRPAIPGHAMASSIMAIGLAVGGRLEEAEQMAERSMKQGKSVCGGLATWAQTYIFDAGGRVSEGISALANFDGIANYEGSGLLFFESRLGGYGARFSLDREERGRGKSAALRLYERNFERILGYSGFAEGQPWRQPLQKAPIGWVKPLAIDVGDSSRSSDSLFTKMFGQKNESAEKEEDYEVIVKQDSPPSRNVDGWEPSCEDVLTWIPPTPQFLSDATLLCLRFTLNGTISARNARWDNVRNAWSAMLDIQRKNGSTPPLQFCPLSSLAASILFPPSETGGDSVGSGRLAQGLHKMGELLQLGNATSESERTTAVRELIAEQSPSFWLPADEETRKEWKEVVDHLASAIDGFDFPNEDNGEVDFVDTSLRFEAWDFEARPILEHSIVYAACKAGDTESLCLARSICSQGVTLRPSAPEEWWRYSIVLGLLGDQVASEDALNTSINVGGGQGARG